MLFVWCVERVSAQGQARGRRAVLARCAPCVACASASAPRASPPALGSLPPPSWGRAASLCLLSFCLVWCCTLRGLVSRLVSCLASCWFSFRFVPYLVLILVSFCTFCLVLILVSFCTLPWVVSRFVLCLVCWPRQVLSLQTNLAVQVARAVGSPGSAVLIFVPGMATILEIMNLFELISSADVTYKV